MADEGLEQRLEGELPADLQGAFDEQGKTVIPGYQAPAVDPEDARTDTDAEEAEVMADAAADDGMLGGADAAADAGSDAAADSGSEAAGAGDSPDAADAGDGS